MVEGQVAEVLMLLYTVKYNVLAVVSPHNSIVSVSQSVSLLHSHIDKVVNVQTKYTKLDLRVRVYVC